MYDKKTFHLLSCIVLVLISSLIQCFAIKTFVLPAHLLSSGFTGLSILISKISNEFGFNFSISLGIILFNLPAIILCIKGISLKFTILSCIQLVLTSILLQFLNFTPLFDDIMLNCLIGGVVYGMCTVLALKADASTGGTDFIALYVSNKIGKSIWSYVFIFNTIMLIVFGFIFGFKYAGYSIIFQFVSTKTIESFHHRYDQITLQITTKYPEEIIKSYTNVYRHGITVTKSYGGYSKEENYLCHSVVSSYELKDIIKLIKKEDPKAIINVLKTENFYGGFYRHNIGEYKG
ncbi:MAG: YitT family protein [Erysipelotrichaceae bacterium]|nr:YitT family protein [Erysipelotrichaceae bacterium]